MQLSISNSSLYALAQAKGYEIEITTDDTSHAKRVTFKGKFSKDARFRLYGKEWKDNEIRMNCLPDLLKWAGLTPTITLEYQ